MLVHFIVPPGATLEVSRARLVRDGVVEEECRVGDAQDNQSSAPAFVVLAGSAWERPAASDGTLYRAIEGAKAAESNGQIAINLFTLYPKVSYSLELEYRLASGSAAFEVWLTGKRLNRFSLAPTEDGFTTAAFELPGMVPGDPVAAAGDAATSLEATVDGREAGAAPAPPAAAEPPRSQTRWPGEGSLIIDAVEFLGDDRREHAVFEHGQAMCLRMKVRAEKGGTYPVIPVAVLYRSDGVKVFSQIGNAASLALEAGDERLFELDLGALNLGDGQYAFAVAIYRKLDAAGESVWYDLIDRDYRFEVTGAPRFMGLVDHVGHWTVS